MKVFYLVAATLAPVDGNSEATSTTFACEATPDLDAMITYASEIGFRATIDVERVETIELSDKPANGYSFFCGWAASHAIAPDADPKSAHPSDPQDERMNELERGQRNMERQLQQLIGLVGSLGKQTAIDEPAPRSLDVVAKKRVEATDDAPGVRRSSRRDRPPEFHGNADHKSNSMATLGTSASPVVDEHGRARGGTRILSTTLDANGDPQVIEEEPTRVGDSLRRGT